MDILGFRDSWFVEGFECRVWRLRVGHSDSCPFPSSSSLLFMSVLVMHVVVVCIPICACVVLFYSGMCHAVKACRFAA